MWLLVGNECQNPPMPQAYVDSDFITISDFKADVIMLNEIGLDRYKKAARRIITAGGHYFENFLDNTQDPIFVRNNGNISVSATRSIKLNDGVKLVTPDRDLNVAKIRFRGVGSVVFMCTHWVSGKDKRGKFRRRLRRRLWLKNLERTAKEVKYWTDAGFWVVIAGDFNDTHIPKFTPNMKWYFDGIIKVGIASPESSKIRLRVDDIKTIKDVHTDKPFRAIRLHLDRFSVSRPIA